MLHLNENSIDRAMMEYAEARKRLDEHTCEVLLDCLCGYYGTEVVAEAYIKYIKN